MMTRVKLLFKRVSKWLYDHTQWISGFGIICIVVFLEFLAVAPDPYVEWFYGKLQPKPLKVEKYIEVKYHDGIPTDTMLIVKKEIREDE